MTGFLAGVAAGAPVGLLAGLWINRARLNRAREQLRYAIPELMRRKQWRAVRGVIQLNNDPSETVIRRGRGG